jgi:hypothetical protein
MPLDRCKKTRIHELEGAYEQTYLPAFPDLSNQTMSIKREA